MKVDIGRYASSIFRSTLIYLASVVLVFGSFSFALPELFGQIARAAVAYNGNISGAITTTSGGVVSGTLSGDYSLVVAGNVTSYINNVATFVGTVSGDISGSVSAQINDNGIDTLSGVITGSGATDPVRIIGTFPQTGVNGEFSGQIITGAIPTLVSNMTIAGQGGATTVEQNSDLQMVASILPEDAANKNVAWSVWWDSGNPSHGEATIDINTGMLTGDELGTVIVIAKSLDGSLVVATTTITVIEVTDHEAPVVGTVEVVDSSVDTPLPDYDPYARGDHKIRVRADVTDNEDVEDLICQITIDGINWTQFSASYNASVGRCIGNIPANYFSNGQVVSGFNVRAIDAAGNTGTGLAVSRTIDSISPTLGSVIVTPSYVDNMAGSVHVESEVTENVSGIVCEQRYWFNLNDGNSSDDWSNWVNTSYEDGKCQLDIGGLTNGRVYEFEMRATDAVGHTSNVVSSGPYIVDDTQPTITFVEPTPQDGVEVGDNSQSFAVQTDNDVEVCTIDLGLGSGTFEDSTLNGWETGGDAAWRISTDAASGAFSAQSGNMWGWNNVSSWISKEISVPYDTSISFDWKVSSEGSYDFLRFYIDGVQQNYISGYYSWYSQTYPISAGDHTITWYYTKDFSITSGSDSGWIDNITVGGVGLGLINAEMTDNGDGLWSYGPVALPEGERTYTVNCIDRVGNNSTTVERTLVVDTIHPAIPELSAPDDGSVTSNPYMLMDWYDAENATSYTYQVCTNNPDLEGYCEDVINENVESSEAYLNDDLVDGTYWWRVLSIDYTGDVSEWSASRSFVLDTTAPDSYVDELSEYKNTQKFDINVVVDDHGSDIGIKYVELWYRKDGASCTEIPDDDSEIEILGMIIAEDDCMDGYVRYTGAGESAEFNPLESIEFDTSLTGGDGYYEFFSIAVDYADNREDYPFVFSELSETGLNQLRVDEDVEEESILVADTSTTVDTVAPVIALIGDAEVTIVKDGTYIDEGAVTDDGSAVLVSGSFDAKTPGTYTLTYSATDAAGNIAASVVRIIKIIAAPVYQYVSTENTLYRGSGEISENGSESNTNSDTESENGEVMGDSDVNDEESDDQNSNGWVFEWYWWILVFIGVGGAIWWIFGRTTEDNE